MKSCGKCKEFKPFKDFYKNKNRYDGVSSYCKDCSRPYTREAQKRYYHRNPEKTKSSYLKTLYGITLQDYQNILRNQKYSCAICFSEKNDLGRYFSVDHCHNTKQVRGLLCNRCNRAIGLLKDDISLLRNAIKYLEKSNEQNVNQR